MMIDSDIAPARSSYQGRMYYFCTLECRDQFESNPARYAARGEVADSRTKPDEEMEKHDPPYTKSGGITAPKFGAAGSGGLEYEPIPEQHNDK
jgi:YHS domain-containing protein